MEAAGFVLAGGRSSRMGRDKALLQLGGETLVERAVRQLAEVCAEVAIAGGGLEMQRYGRVIADEQLNCGPLGGIVAALESSRYAWNCVLAVDVPFVPAVAWRRLMDKAQACVAVLPVVQGKVQPLCGVYARNCLEILRGEMQAGRWRVLGALETAGSVRLVEFADEAWFRNVNTPEEFAAAGQDTFLR